MNLFLGQIVVVPYNFAPTGFALCDGQLLPISQNTALFSLLGVNFGGNGTSTFGLPNLQDCMAIDWGQGNALPYYDIGQAGGEMSVQLNSTQMPSHTHSLMGTAAAGHEGSPTGAVFAAAARGHTGSYVATPAPANLVALNAVALSSVGSGGAHTNVMPSLGLTYIIALSGVFPSRP